MEGKLEGQVHLPRLDMVAVHVLSGTVDVP